MKKLISVSIFGSLLFLSACQQPTDVQKDGVCNQAQQNAAFPSPIDPDCLDQSK